MTRYDEEAREGMVDLLMNKLIVNFEYDEEGDYYTVTIEGGQEFSFRFMADIEHEVHVR